jgi:uncharacterized protein YjbJ (UPF0337 family)
LQIHFDTATALAQFVGTLPTFIAVILAWMNSNGRIGDVNGRIGDVNGRIGDMKTDMDKRIGDVNSRIGDMKSDIDKRIDDVHGRIGDMKSEIGKRIDDIRDIIRAEGAATRAELRAELRRVEEVMDARLKHLEEREH